MNNGLMTSAWKSTLPPDRKIVLLALCDSANENAECYTTVSKLADKCSLDQLTVLDNISSLVRDGSIRRDLPKGRFIIFSANFRKKL